jgi:hypothetical protein
MDTLVALPEPLSADRRIVLLEAENARLRSQLSRATEQADTELRRNQRLGRIVETERFAAEQSVATFKRDLADGAARRGWPMRRS